MESKKKIAFFDFCETIVNFQTADAFVDFVREKTQSKIMQRKETVRSWLHSHYFFTILGLISFAKYPINKKIKLAQLRGFTRDKLEQFAKEYYQAVIKPNFIDHILNRMLELQNNGYEIVIVSGGYDIYLRYFAEEYNINNVISTRIGFDRNDVCTGTFDGLDCLYKNKVRLLDEIYEKDNIHSIAFSDSSSDIPFLMWAESAYVVSKGQHQRWQDNYKFNEIIW